MKLSDISNSNMEVYSHIPILEAIPQLITIKRIVETGSGDLSTKLFLDGHTYPDLVHLTSFENNNKYSDRLQKEIINSKWHYQLNNISMVNMVQTLDLTQFDLCFIDDSELIVDRVETIRYLTNKCTDNVLIVIHDFQCPEYQQVVNSQLKVFNISKAMPNTGLVWSGDFWSNEMCSKLVDLAS